MHITLCGRVSIVGEAHAPVAVTRSQVQLCLAVLATERHRGVDSEELADLLWPGALPAHWPGALRGVLTKLRRVFDQAGAGDVLERTGSLLQLRSPAGIQVDVEQAAHQVRAGEDALLRGDAHQALDAARGAVEIVTPRYLPAVDLPWADARRAEVDQLRRRAERLLARAHLDVGHPEPAAALLHRLLTVDPFDDESQLLLARTLAADGERLQAIAALDAYAAVLADELGVGPGADHVELRRELAAARGEDDAVPVRDGATGPVPPATHPAPPRLFGRDDQRRTLVEAVLHGTTDGPQRPPGLTVVVVEGEPGVGKTALAETVASEVEAAGRLVLWGSCSPYGTIPYQPVSEALARVLGDHRWAPALHDVVGVLGPIVGSSTPPQPDGASRLGLFRAAADALGCLATDPALWVVDDVQWATPDTLHLLTHLVATGTHLPITLVLIQRHASPDVATAVAQMARSTSVDVVRLRGLETDALADWVGSTGLPVPPAWVERLQRRTGGNPLFVRYLVDDASDGAIDPDGLPAALRTLLDARMAAVSGDAELVLSVAAVHGSPAPFPVLAAVSGLAGGALVSAVDELVRAGLLVEAVAGARFRHGLVEEAALERLGAAKRAWLHRRVATVLEAQPAREVAAAELARHHLAAGAVHGDDVRRWSIEAGRQALASAAWAAAAHHASEALRVSPLVDDRIEALLVSARAQRGLGEHGSARNALAQAVDLARAHRRSRAMAEAVLELVGGGGRGVPDDARFQKVALVEEALAALDETDHGADGAGEASGDADALRIPLLGAKTVALLLTDRYADRTAAAAEALTRARRHGDPILLAGALLDQRFGMHPAALDPRLAAADEALALAEASDRPDVAVAALVYRLEDLLRSGDRTGARATEARAQALLVRHPDPYWSWALATWGALQRVLDGDLDRAEQEATAAFATAADRADAVACWGVNVVMVRVLQDRAADVVGLLEDAAHQNPAVPCYRAVLAYALAAAGQTDRARAELERFVARGAVDLPVDTNHLLALAMLAETAVELGDATCAHLLAAELEPYAGQHVVLNCYGGGGAVWGPVDAHLGALAELRGDHPTARRWFDAARAEAGRLGDRPFLARLDPSLAS